jgi:uncharacterized membrane protein
VLAASVVFIGGLWYLARQGWSIADYGTFRGEPQHLRNIRGIVGGVHGGGPRSLIQLGLLLLIATPVVRVAFSVVAFAMQHDRLYVAMTILVLAILCGSLLGLTGGIR